MTKPPLILGVDFETSSACDLTRAGAWAYSLHESTIVLCAVFSFSRGKDDPHIYIHWEPGQELPGMVLRALRGMPGLKPVPLLAHNRSFEHAIVTNVLKWGIPADRWLDTMPMAQAINFPRPLDGVAFALGCPTQKDAEGKKLMLQMCKATDDGEGGYRYPLADNPKARKRLLRYCELDVGTMLDCYWRLPELSEVEEKVLAADLAINRRGVYIDRKFAANCAYLARQRKDELDREVFSLTAAELANSRSPTALKDWLRSNDVEIPKVLTKRKGEPELVSAETCGKAAVAKMLKDPDLKDEVRQVLLNRVESNKISSLSKLDRVPEMVAGDGRLYDALAYAAAHTLRWSSYGMQLHNLAKNKMRPGESALVLQAIQSRSSVALDWATDKPLAAISQSIRSMICAPPGREFLASDWSAIQARILPWLAGHQALLELFRKDAPVYVITAASFGLHGCGKGQLTMESSEHRAVCPLCALHRDVGKVATLSLGFMMGPQKFAVRGAESGIDLPLKEWKRLHVCWRADNQPIVDFWPALGDAAMDATRNPGQAFRAGRITAIASKLCLQLVLPSGRRINYWHPRVVWRTKTIETVNDAGQIVQSEMEGDELWFSKPNGAGFVRESTYSGKLAENVTQAVEAELMGLALCALERPDSPLATVVHVHDSICCEVPKGAGSVQELCDIMETLPPWAKGLPLKAEGYRSDRFRG